MGKKISIIVPFYNEAAGIEPFFQRLIGCLENCIGFSFEVIAINDGSQDATQQQLLSVREQYRNIYLLELSRNFGKEAALTAGLDRASGDVVIPIDADLQHPPELIREMLEKWSAGADVVLARRNDRVTDKRWQRLMVGWFYRMHNQISDINIPSDVGDFRLLDRKVVVALRSLPENRRFMKGLFAWVGFRVTTVSYDVEPRFEGKSKFGFWKLWNFAVEGITSFSTVPLRIWTYVGAGISMLAIVYAVYIATKTIVLGGDLPGFASIMVAILFLGGVQLIGIGVLGEYIGRIYIEAKRRPNYIVMRELPIEDPTN